MVSAIWQNAKARRREARRNLTPQPRSPLGFIIKRDKDGDHHVWDTQRAFENALMERHDDAAAEVVSAMRKRSRSHSKPRKRDPLNIPGARKESK